MQARQSGSQKRKAISKKLWWWAGRGILALLILGLGFLYLRGFFRSEVEYKITNAPALDDPRFPLLVVSLTNALPTSDCLTDF
jgi:cardiolipin synthase